MLIVAKEINNVFPLHCWAMTYSVLINDINVFWSPCKVPDIVLRVEPNLCLFTEFYKSLRYQIWRTFVQWHVRKDGRTDRHVQANKRFLRLRLTRFPKSLSNFFGILYAVQFYIFLNVTVEHCHTDLITMPWYVYDLGQDRVHGSVKFTIARQYTSRLLHATPQGELGLVGRTVE